MHRVGRARGTNPPIYTGPACRAPRPAAVAAWMPPTQSEIGMARSLRRLAQLATHCTAASSPTSNESNKVGSPDSRSSMSLGDAVAMKKPGATNQADAGRTAGVRLSLATCQFGISADVRHNVAEVKRQMREVRPHPCCQTAWDARRSCSLWFG